jgi:hypothetical protein
MKELPESEMYRQLLMAKTTFILVTAHYNGIGRIFNAIADIVHFGYGLSLKVRPLLILHIIH